MQGTACVRVRSLVKCSKEIIERNDSMHKDDFKGIDNPPITPDIPTAIPHPQN